MFVQLDTQGTSLFDRVGGEAFFNSLVDDFYDRVAVDPALRPLYPEDLGPPRRHLALFLMQYWGGPRTYDQERGHPRLRMRHVPFAIGATERDAWLTNMLAAVQGSPATAEDRETLRTYFETAAESLVNHYG